MPQTLDSVEELALTLSFEDRRTLAYKLLETVDPPEDIYEELSAEQLAEFERRIADFESGRTQAIPWEVVKKEMEELINRA